MTSHPVLLHIVHSHSPTVSFSSVEHLCTSYTQGGVSDQLMIGDEVVSTGHDRATVAACANEADMRKLLAIYTTCVFSHELHSVK